MMRLIQLTLLLICGIFVTPLISLPLAIVYALRYYALELILIGYVFDVYFGKVADWPYYTLILATLVLLAEIAKRNLMVKGGGRG